MKYVDQWYSEAIKVASAQKTYFDKNGQRRKDFFFEVYAQKELTNAFSCENQLRKSFPVPKRDVETKKLKDLDL